MNKIIVILAVLISVISMSAPENEARKILDNQERQLEQERLRIEQKQKQSEFENTQFDKGSNVEAKGIVSSDNSKKFLITEINLRDNNRLLSKKEKSRIIDKYKDLELSSADITNLLTEFTNKLIVKGYTTSTVTVMSNNDLTTGKLNLAVIPGKIEEIKINSENSLDKLKEFFIGTITFDFLTDKMEKDPTVTFINAGVPMGFGFTKDRREKLDKLRKQYVDVGIAEEHATTFSSGMATNGAKPVFGVISTFIQRTYDQISHDIAINKAPTVTLVFGGTLKGMNDVTHLGYFDIPMISNIPNIVYLAPTTKEEYLAMIDWAIDQNENPVFIKVPGGAVQHSETDVDKDYSNLNSYKVVEKGNDVVIIGLGEFFSLGKEVKELLKEKTGIDATLINPRFISGVDENLLNELKENHKLVVTLESGQKEGGFGTKISSFYGTSNMKVLNVGAKKEFTDEVPYDVFFEENRLTKEQIVENILMAIK